MKVASENKRGTPKNKQKASHAHEDQGRTSANILNEISQNARTTTNPSSRGGRGRGNTRGTGSSIDEANSRRRESSNGKNLEPIFNVTSRGETYLGSVISNGENHGITTGRENEGFYIDTDNTHHHFT